MIATVAAVVLAFLGAIVMSVSGEERARGQSCWKSTAWGGLALIALALATVAS